MGVLCGASDAGTSEPYRFVAVVTGEGWIMSGWRLGYDACTFDLLILLVEIRINKAGPFV